MRDKFGRPLPKLNTNPKAIARLNEAVQSKMKPAQPAECHKNCDDPNCPYTH